MQGSCWNDWVDADKREHNFYYVSLVMASFLLYAITCGLNGLSGSSTGYLFPYTTGNVSDTFYIDITPAGWVFALIWSIIFIWQAIWMVYAFVCLFRRTSDGSLLYRKVDFFYFGIFIAFAINNIFIITWLFVWANKLVGLALLFIVLLTCALHVALFMSLRKLYKNKHQMERLNLKADIWLTRILTHNGMAFYLTWLSLASNLNFASFLHYVASIDLFLSSTIALIIILGCILVYFVLENLIYHRYLLYVFTPWVVVIIALSGSIAKNWNSSSPSRNNIITLILLVITVVLAIGKIVMFILYHTVLKNRVERLIDCSNRNKVREVETSKEPLNV